MAACHRGRDPCDLKVVQATLRHTRLSTTSDIYTHVLEEIQRGAADSMDTVLGDLTQAKPTVKKTAATKKGKPHDHARAGPAENRAPIPTAT